MSGASLQDQLLKLGLAKKKPGKRRAPRRAEKNPKRSVEDADSISLARAYSERTRLELREKARAQREKRELERRRREVNVRLNELIPPAARNDPQAEEARYFQYAGKIRKLFVTPEQQRRLNRGELGIVSFKGRHYIVEVEVLEQTRAIKPEAVAFFAPDLDPDSGNEDDEPGERKRPAGNTNCFESDPIPGRGAPMSKRIDPERLHGSWIHADEEDRDDRVVLRRPDHPFQPRRMPREALTMGADGTAEMGSPGPADRRLITPESWRLEDDRLTLTGSGKLSGRFRIVAVDEGKLVLRRYS